MEQTVADYLSQIEKRDKIEQEKKLTNMVQHIYDLTHTVLRMQKESTSNSQVTQESTRGNSDTLLEGPSSGVSVP